jgi:LmbE family N-acetylglucosaminyl deacetylase
LAVVLFVFAHPDDETLGAAVAIAEHVSAGHDVHVLMMTRGTASGVLRALNGEEIVHWWGVRHDPTREDYAPLSSDDLGAVRIVECDRALRCLSDSDHSLVHVHEGGLIDTQVAQADAELRILAICEVINPGGAVWLKGHTHLVDDNPDHTNIGKALKAVAAADPARFGNLRHYVLPRYWNDPRLGQVVKSWDTPTDSVIHQRAVNAMRCYGAWAPESGSYAVGFHSVYTDMFAPKLDLVMDMYHK